MYLYVCIKQCIKAPNVDGFLRTIDKFYGTKNNPPSSKRDQMSISISYPFFMPSLALFHLRPKFFTKNQAGMCDFSLVEEYKMMHQ